MSSTPNKGYRYIAVALLLCIPIIPLAITPLFPISIALIITCIYLWHKGYTRMRAYAHSTYAHIGNTHMDIPAQSPRPLQHGHHRPHSDTEDAPLPVPPVYPPADLSMYDTADDGSIGIDSPIF